MKPKPAPQVPVPWAGRKNLLEQLGINSPTYQQLEQDLENTRYEVSSLKQTLTQFQDQMEQQHAHIEYLTSRGIRETDGELIGAQWQQYASELQEHQTRVEQHHAAQIQGLHEAYQHQLALLQEELEHAKLHISRDCICTHFTARTNPGEPATQAGGQ